METSDAEPIENIRVIGIECERRVVGADGFFVPRQRMQDEAIVRQQIRRMPILFQGRRKVAQRLCRPAQLIIEEAEQVQSIEMLRVAIEDSFVSPLRLRQSAAAVDGMGLLEQECEIGTGTDGLTKSHCRKAVWGGRARIMSEMVAEQTACRPRHPGDARFVSTANAEKPGAKARLSYARIRIAAASVVAIDALAPLVALLCLDRERRNRTGLKTAQ
jgi:hypothetical protein